jgi:predicted site-specific integrase-resolvase
MAETVEAADALIDTEGVAKLAVVSPRTIQNWVAQKKIPVIRISSRCVRYNKQAVTAALAKFTVKEAVQ